MSHINPLRRLYNSLSEQLSEDDDRSLRNLLRGDQLTTRDVEHLKSPADIFIKLEESGHISKTELLLLKELLKAIKRHPLVDEVERVEKELHGCQLERVRNSLEVNSTGSPPSKHQSGSSESLCRAESKYPDIVLRCERHLKSLYEKVSEILPFPWWDGTNRLELANVYTELELKTKKEEKIDFPRRDIFSSKKTKRV
ncbi:uncharacterized protein [Ptychodera flava]|uniref:uncharacterized protein n=1 Tax=Ptychodera flava TaxID=63121 RepID=UPI003969F109